MKADDQRKNKAEQNHMREDYKRLKNVETCEVLVLSIL